MFASSLVDLLLCVVSCVRAGFKFGSSWPPVGHTLALDSGTPANPMAFLAPEDEEIVPEVPQWAAQKRGYPAEFLKDDVLLHFIKLYATRGTVQHRADYDSPDRIRLAFEDEVFLWGSRSDTGSPCQMRQPRVPVSD